MGLLRFIANSPMALLVCALAGGVAGWYVPFLSHAGLLIGQLYMAFINLAAFPLLVVITLFGLKRTLQLPKPLARFFMIAVYAIAIVASCALVGVLFSGLVGIGGHLEQDKLQYMGGVVQSAGGESVDARMELFGKDPEQNGIAQWTHMVPQNYFKALIDGKILGILICTIILGVGTAWVDKKKSAHLMEILDGIYRALELIISQVNLFIPLLVFGMSAYFAATATTANLRAMGGFVAFYISMALAITTLAVVFISKKTKLSFSDVALALKTPMLISLTSSNSTASIPDTIHAMSSRLGYSRGVVEFVVPAASVFMRAGAALYFAALAVFIGNLYGHALNLESIGTIILAATLAAFASSGHNGIAVVGFAGLVLHALNLPFEAALIMFIAIDHLCEGPRSLLSLMLGCVLIVLVSQGLPSERVDSSAFFGNQTQKKIRFTFTLNTVLLALFCFVLMAVLILIMGVGVGMR